MAYRILYDGDCAFCRKSIAILHKLDWRGVFDYVNVREPLPWLEEPPVRGAPLLDQIHVLTPAGKLYGGYAAMRRLAWLAPPLWPVAPFMYLPGIAQLGDRVYRWVARNRFKLVPCQHGACQIKR
jgi:predicted DCC family thiol-disulfide oxidoreductase YuxK